MSIIAPNSPEYYTSSERSSLIEQPAELNLKADAARKKWSCVDPLANQATHRKNDYGTILKLLTSLQDDSPLIQSVKSAESIPREVGTWFVVKGEERAVVKLGIGANPGLKKYYWRANSSKRLLKREMEDAEAEASLVYIIQKACTVSKRCAAIPGSDVWLVMYLPATMRNESGSGPRRAAAAAAAAAGTSGAAAGPSGRVSRKRGRAASPTTKAKTAAAARRAAAAAAGPSGQKKKGVANSVSSLAKSAGPSGRLSSEQPSAKRQCQPGFRATALSAVSLSPSRDSIIARKKGIADEAAAVAESSSYPSAVAYDVLAANDDLVSELDNSAAFFLDSTFDDEMLTADCGVAADPFLPLAGSQTIFSAAIEAACMSGQHFPWMAESRASPPLPQLFTF